MPPERTRTRIEHEADTRSVAVAVWLYRRTRGRITRLWHRRAIVLTTTGRRSGRRRTVLVQVFPDGTDLYVVAANSGLARPPAWYVNLLADPHVTGEVDGRRLALRAERVADADVPDRWRHVLKVAPDYERYRRRSGRIPPIVRLTPDPSRPAPPAPRVATLSHLAATTGALAGLGGLIHGIGEVRQGNAWTGGLFFESWTDGRIASNLGGEPGLSVVPHLLATGVLTLGASVAVTWWALRRLDRRYGGRGLAALSVLMLLVGGGVGPPVLGLLAALAAGAAHRGDRVPRWLEGRLGRAFAASWPALFWLCVAVTAYLVVGSVVVGVVLDVDISDSFVAALLVAAAAMPAATAAGVADRQRRVAVAR